MSTVTVNRLWKTEGEGWQPIISQEAYVAAIQRERWLKTPHPYAEGMGRGT